MVWRIAYVDFQFSSDAISMMQELRINKNHISIVRLCHGIASLARINSIRVEHQHKLDLFKSICIIHSKFTYSICMRENLPPIFTDMACRLIKICSIPVRSLPIIVRHPTFQRNLSMFPRKHRNKRNAHADCTRSAQCAIELWPMPKENMCVYCIKWNVIQMEPFTGRQHCRIGICTVCTLPFAQRIHTTRRMDHIVWSRMQWTEITKYISWPK